MNNSLAIVFPGQGSQSVGMLASLAAKNPIVEQIFSQASEHLGYDVWSLVQEGPKEKLNQTEYTQPALLAADYAVWSCWRDAGGELPAMMAGHSLGEYAALVCAGSLTFGDALRLVAARGRFMQQAVAEGVGSMAAIIGLDQEQVTRICVQAAQGQIVAPANLNSPEQIVIAGHAIAVDRAVEIAKQQGAKLATLIPVSVPSHCPLMQEAADQLKQTMDGIAIRPPTIKILHNIDANFHQSPEEISEALILQLTNPVRWVEIIKKMHELGIRSCYECGPGRVLTNLNKRITPQMQNESISLTKKIDELFSRVK